MLNYKTKGDIKNQKARFIKFNGFPVEYIDCLPTAIKSVHSNFKRGFIINDNLTLKPCYIANFNGFFAHGKTLKEAISEAKNKYFSSKSVIERMIEFEKLFKKGKKYPNKEFFKWHNLLTGSCLMGRENFCLSKGIDLNDRSTPEEFIELCKNYFGGEIIKQLYTSKNNVGSGYGEGYGYGDGDGSGSGYGYGYGDCSGSGSGYGDGSGDGSGSGSGDGDGSGDGYGDGSGSGYGYGDGYGDGYG